MKLINVKLYRITHIENIPHILKFGITNKESQNKNPDYINIGDLSLIGTRNQQTVCIDNGDYNSNNKSTLITLGEYIPFYFGIKMPMLYVTQQGGNFVERANSPTDIVYLALLLNEVLDSNVDYYFTDGHATDKLTTFYDATKVNELVDIVDWDAVKSSYWGGHENLNLKRKKQAEFLISGDISPKLINGYGCYDEKAKNKLISFGINDDKIKIVRNAYY